MTCRFVDRFSESADIKFNNKMCSGRRVGLRTDGRTEMKKLIVDFRNLVKAPQTIQLTL